jgi:DNA-binding LacI/PurR family transcriptional regulator
MNKKTRMSDVARKAKVSEATVSLVLSDHPRISAATKTRVRKVCLQMGYQPDPVAKALAHKVSKAGGSTYLGTLALLEGELRAKASRTPWGEQWNRQLVEACSSMGYRLDHFVVGETEKGKRRFDRPLCRLSGR